MAVGEWRWLKNFVSSSKKQKALNVIQILLVNTMAQNPQTTISIRIDKVMHNEMKLHDEINWSGILRRTIAQELAVARNLDRERALKALGSAALISKGCRWTGKKGSTEVIREWRDKRR